LSDIEKVEAQILELAPMLESARGEVGRALIGQKYMVDRLLIGLLADGHVLVEGVPGLAKTTAVKALAQAMDLDFSRIQFTPDLLPADLVGTQIYQPSSGEFTTRKGPIFGSVLLADEINRSPAKVQSALLEAMQERQVTIGDNTWKLPEPFLVLATQNPLEQEGTYPLPEAQVDRFMMKLLVTYPSLDEEIEILDLVNRPPANIQAVTNVDAILGAQNLVREIKIKDLLMRYIVDLVRATRDPGSVDKELARTIEVGASPRASIALAAASRAHAMLDGRGYVLPEDVKAIAPDVLRHRVVPTYEAEADEISVEAIIGRILDVVDQP
jgi:MoxR-like ATPase